jgi:arylsulfatase
MYGYGRNTTPHLSSIAEDGLVFANSYVPGVGTPTSFGGTFTGSYIDAVQLNYEIDHWQRALGGRTLFSEALKDAGYYCGGIHANARLHRDYGWNRGWDVYGDYEWKKAESNGNEKFLSWNKIKKDILLPFFERFGMAGEAMTARNIIFKHNAYTPWESLWQEIEEFVKNAPEPWFLWVLLIDTHHPWYSPEEYQQYEQPGFRQSHLLHWLMRFRPDRVEERDERIVNAYDNELRHADAFIQKLDKLFTTTGNSDIPFIVHSDHGDDLGEHGRYGHGPEMYDTVTRVPLVMRNVGKTGRIERPVTHLDLPNTILRLAETDTRLGDQYSLIEEPRDEAAVVVENFLDNGDLTAAATDGEWKVMYHPDRGYEAYNTTTDQFEQSDRFGDHPSSLERVVKQHREERLSDHPNKITEHGGGGNDELRDVREDLMDLGYID